MKLNKKLACMLAMAGIVCVAVSGCAYQTVKAPGTDDKTISQSFADGKDVKVDEESPLKVQEVKYDVTESSIVIKLQNTSKSHMIGGFEVDMTAKAIVNGQSELTKLDMKTYGGYIGFKAQNTDGYVAYNAIPLLGLVLQPGEVKIVKLPFVGTMYDDEGRTWFEKKDSCNIERIMLNAIRVIDYNGKTLSYAYPDDKDMSPNYNNVKPAVGDSRMQVVDEKSYSVAMSEYKYVDAGVNFKLKFENKSDKDMHNVKLIYMFTNKFGVKQCFRRDIGDFKAGETKDVEVLQGGVEAYNLAPEFQSVILYKNVK